MTQISFPGLGIEEFTLNPAAISFGESFSVYWYAIFVIMGFALAFLYAWYRSRYEKIKFYDLLDVTLYTIIFSIIGARLFYVIFADDQFNGFLDLIAIWDGGLAMYGAMIAGAVTIAITGRIKKLSVLKMLDLAAPALMLGQAVGSWGSFFNGEAYGKIIPEENPLYFIRMGISPHVFEDVKGLAYVHPTFLYEFIWLIIGFALIHFLYKKKKFDGQITLMYLAWYGFGKIFTEALRVDSLTLGVFKVAQVIGFVCFVAGTVALIYNLAKSYRKQKDLEEYTPSYKKISNPASLFMSNDNENEDEDYTPSFNFSRNNENEQENKAGETDEEN